MAVIIRPLRMPEQSKGREQLKARCRAGATSFIAPELGERDGGYAALKLGERLTLADGQFSRLKAGPLVAGTLALLVRVCVVREFPVFQSEISHAARPLKLLDANSRLQPHKTRA